MNIPRSLGKAAAIGALAFNAGACDPGECHVTRNSNDGRYLDSAKEVFDSCERNHDQMISCLVVSEDGDDIKQMPTSCDDPNLYSTLTKTFDEHDEGDDDSDRYCVDNGGATVSCTD